MGELIWEFLSGIVGSILGERWTDRRRRKAFDKGRAQCGFRVVSGAVPGLTSKWQHGDVQFDGNRIQFSSRPARHKAEFAIDWIDPGSPHAPSTRESWSVSPKARILRARVGSATIECAVLADQLDWFVSAAGSARN